MPGTGSVYSDPLFVNPSANNFNLQANSCCIDAGKNNYDIGSFADTTIPNAISDLQFHPAPLTYFTWTNPTFWTNGQYILYLNEVMISINEETVAVYEDCIPGETMYYFDPNIQDDEEHRVAITVNSEDVNGWPFESAKFCFRSETGTLPYSPENLVADVINTDVSLEWNHPDANLPGAGTPEFYRIYRDDEQIAEIAGGMLSYLDEQLTVNEATYHVCAVYSEGIESAASNSVFVQLNGAQNDIPKNQVQLSNYPNPFNPSTIISFSIKQNKQYELSIYNLKGQKVKTFTFLNRELGTSERSVVWDGTDQNNKPVSSGIYFAKLKSGKIEASCKMLLLK